MSMYCQYCGTQLPDGAKFCVTCGKPVTTTTGNTPWSYQPPVKESSQYNPVGQNAYSETVPLEQKPSYTEPAKQAPVYTTPVNNNSMYTEPVHPYTPYTEPVKRTSGYTEPVNDGTEYTEPICKYPPPPKRVRKLPILLGAIAVVAVLALAIGSGDKKEEPRKEEKNEPAITETEKPKAEFSDETPRYNDETFLFTHQEFEELYEAELNENDSPFKLEYDGESTGYYFIVDSDQEDTQHSSLKRDAKGNVNIEKDDKSGKAVSVSVNTIYDTDCIEAALYMIDAAYGNLTGEDWQRIADLVERTDSGVQMRAEFNDLILTIAKGDSFALQVAIPGCESNILVKTNSPKTEQSQSNPGTTNTKEAALKKYPDGKLRFNNNGFLMEYEEFVQLLQYYLEQEDISFVFSGPTGQEEEKKHYSIKDDNGTNLGFMIITIDTATKKVQEVSMNYNYQPDEDEHENGVNASLCLIEAAHGNMTEEHWRSISNAKPLAEREDYTIMKYKLDGMEASITIREDRLFVNIKVA